MKKILFLIALVTTIIILFLGYNILGIVGGGSGNIEKYSFANVNPDSLKAALNKVYIKYPELIKTDTTMFGVNDGTDFYYVAHTEDEKIVFICNVVIYDPPYERDIDLSLTTAAVWGQTMQLAPEMGFFEKRKYRKLFEKTILPKIKEELGTNYTNYRIP